MNNTLSPNQIVAQAAANWNEAQEHNKVMAALENVKGKMVENHNPYEYSHYWKVTALTEDEVSHVIERGNHDEIIKMITKYNQTIYWHPDDPNLWSFTNKDDIDGAWFTDEQIGHLVDRNNLDEFRLLIECHKLPVSEEKRLFAKGDNLWCDTYAKRHGWCEEITNNMLEKLIHTGDKTEFYEFIEKHEFPPECLDLMLMSVAHDEFIAYINRYGLWDNAHEKLIEIRDEDEIVAYINRHRHLCEKAQKMLAHTDYHKAKLAYAENRYHKHDFTLLGEMLLVDPLDYEVITKMMVQVEECGGWISHYKNNDEEDNYLMKNGTHEEVMKRLAERPLNSAARLYLLFRGNSVEFEFYLNKWVRKEEL